MDQTYKNCQSCRMPLKKSRNSGGTYADASRSRTYCSYSYEKGQFTQPDWTAAQMQEYAKAKMKQMRFPGFLAGLFTKGIPKLKRWIK